MLPTSDTHKVECTLFLFSWFRTKHKFGIIIYTPNMIRSNFFFRPKLYPLDINSSRNMSKYSILLILSCSKISTKERSKKKTSPCV